MYTLTLTHSEREAFDWVGNRYASGQIGDLLLSTMPDSDLWNESTDVTFAIPEHTAWEISTLADSDDSRFPCFSSDLVGKLESFIASIV